MWRFGDRLGWYDKHRCVRETQDVFVPVVRENMEMLYQFEHDYRLKRDSSHRGGTCRRYGRPDSSQAMRTYCSPVIGSWLVIACHTCP